MFLFPQQLQQFGDGLLSNETAEQGARGENSLNVALPHYRIIVDSLVNTALQTLHGGCVETQGILKSIREVKNAADDAVDMPLHTRLELQLVEGELW